MNRKTILLVEDDFLNRRFTKKTLAENGYTIFECKNAIEAFGILNKQTPDLIILDINLGEKEKNGIALAQDIKERFNIPFVFLTAYDTADIVQKAINTSPQSYITKPFKNVDLITAVELAIRQFANLEKRKPSVLVKDGEYNIELSIDEIIYIESDGNYLLFHTNQNIYKNRSTIKQVVEVLPIDTFIQTHRAYVVNKSKIEKYSIKSIVVKNTEIPISKNYIPDVSLLAQ
ncbi:MAG TPA: response regulator transcription factor [Chitinophagaceae bacterium]|jgi:DNA-binding LytR/AlgR family response regulator|nr:response regulator transcription factor [Chitinophagaceae bacterium]